jgi:hypothetical protein
MMDGSPEFVGRAVVTKVKVTKLLIDLGLVGW